MNISNNRALVSELKVDYSTILKTFQSSKFSALRPSQSFVLQAYSDSYCVKSDIAVELPTGAGKSLISLLIAEQWRKAGKKVCILTANKTLARQMKEESDDLGIPSVMMEGRGVDIPAPDKRAYHRAQKVAIMNYWVYFNQNPVLDPADLLIMDDAHLAEHCLNSLYSMEISQKDHNEIFNKIVQMLISYFPEYKVLHDALDDSAPPFIPPELLTFLDQVAVSETIRNIIDTSEIIKQDTDLRYRWDRIRPSINEINIYLGLNAIWFRPYIYPLNDNTQMMGTQQRIYMSATIGDTNDIGRRLGVIDIEKIQVPTEYSNVTNGRRLIVMNKIEEQDIPKRLQYAVLDSLQKHPKSIWLCSSENEALKMQSAVRSWLESNGYIGHPYWLLSNLGDEIDQFKRSQSGHLFIAGRFDGMDFKGDECRLVILNTLPRAINLQEEFFCAYLRDAEFMSHRLNQRIIQALGRCNRDDSDFGVYVLADRRFATHFGRESNRTGIPRNIIAEIDLSENLTEESIEYQSRKIHAFLNEDFAEHDRELIDVAQYAPDYSTNRIVGINSRNEVLGWTALFNNKNYAVAAEKFKLCHEEAQRNNLLETSAFYLWCHAKALYLDGILGDGAKIAKALELLEQAVARGGQSAWFNRLKASLYRMRNQTDSSTIPLYDNCGVVMIQRFDDILDQYGIRDARYQKWVNRTRTQLTSQFHNEYLSGLRTLGMLLGYNVTSPSNSAATDCRWKGVFGNSKELITFEAKIEHNPTQFITSSDIGQAHVQYERARYEFDCYGYSVRSCVVTHLTNIDPSAESSIGGIKLVSKDSMLALYDQVISLLNQYRDNWSLNDISVRKSASNAIMSKLPRDRWLIDALDTDSRWIKIEHLFLSR